MSVIRDACDRYLEVTQGPRLEMESTLALLGQQMKESLEKYGVNPKPEASVWCEYWRDHDAISKIVDPKSIAARKSFEAFDDNSWRLLQDSVSFHPIAKWLTGTFGGGAKRKQVATVIRDHVSDDNLVLSESVDREMASAEYGKARRQAVRDGVIIVPPKPKSRVVVDPHHSPPHWILPAECIELHPEIMNHRS